MFPLRSGISQDVVGALAASLTSVRVGCWSSGETVTVQAAQPRRRCLRFSEWLAPLSQIRRCRAVDSSSFRCKPSVRTSSHHSGMQMLLITWRTWGYELELARGTLLPSLLLPGPAPHCCVRRVSGLFCVLPRMGFPQRFVNHASFPSAYSAYIKYFVSKNHVR